MKLKLERYISPSACSATELEIENPILGSSQIDVMMKVDPLEEYYYDGTEDTANYLIDF